MDAPRRLVEENRRLTVFYKANAVSILVGSSRSILNEELALGKLSARKVPKPLSPDQLNLRSGLPTVILTKIEAH